MKCPNKEKCGKEIPDDSLFCPHCGIEIPHKKNPWPKILVTALLVIGIGFALYYFGIEKWVGDSHDTHFVSITAMPNNETMGSVYGGGYYANDTIIMLTALPQKGYKFVSWDDGNIDNPREVEIVKEQNFVAIFASDSTNHKSNQMVSHSSQKQFDDLCEEFNRRMIYPLSFDNAYQLIIGDYELLQNILIMMNDDQVSSTESKTYYIRCFQTRADEAIKIIEQAVFSPDLPCSERDDFILTYEPQINKIKQIQNNL